MTYDELWHTAHAIGFHRGRMQATNNHEGMAADRDAFDRLLESIPYYWHAAAHHQHSIGIEEGVSA